MKHWRATTLTWSLVVASLLLAHGAFAQQLPRYAPARPTISPYFNYFRSNTAGLPQYYFFVRPEVQRRGFVQNQRVVNAYQSLRIGDVERQLRIGAAAPSVPQYNPAGTRGTSRPLSVMPSRPVTGAPATAASFMNYLHFYPAASPVRSTR